MRREGGREGGGWRNGWEEERVREDSDTGSGRGSYSNGAFLTAD